MTTLTRVRPAFRFRMHASSTAESVWAHFDRAVQLTSHDPGTPCAGTTVTPILEQSQASMITMEKVP